MLNVLINAYAVSPCWGSEPGVGWNWVINIAKSCNVFVITESEWKEEILKELKNLPQKDNLHFFFNPVSDKIRKICWNQGDWRFYWYYRKWQKKTLKIAEQIIAENHIDVMHQLNMIGFREPGYLWNIKDIPLVWGPVGGLTYVPYSFLNGCSLKVKFKSLLKNRITKFQYQHGRVKKMIKRSNQLITVLHYGASVLQQKYGLDNIIVMPETGLKITQECIHTVPVEKPITLLWVGRFIPTKKLDIALEILSKVNSQNNVNCTLHIVGWGSQKETKRYQTLAKELGIEKECKWYGKLPNSEVQELMKKSDILLFTSIVEGTPHVVLEAVANNLPVLCFDRCGQGVIIDDSIGWKIPINDFDEAISDMIAKLNEINSNRNLIISKSKNCEIRKPELTWDAKIEKIIRLYHQIANY